MFKKFAGVLLLFLLFDLTSGYSQSVQPKGEFLEDTISIGKSIPYALSIKYPKALDIVFPDSIFDFSPYEIEEKIYFPTVSDDEFSFDSAVYYITTFEIDTVQYLALPIYLLQGGDSVEIKAAQDSVILRQLVTEIPDSVAVEAMPLKESTIYKSVDL